MTPRTKNTVTEKVCAASVGVCFACGKVKDDLGSPLVAKRRREDGTRRAPGAVKVGRWTYGLYHSMCEVPERLRP